MRISLAQINPVVGDLKGNRDKIVDYIKKARDVNADIVVFPEMIISGYPPGDLLLKDHFVEDNLKILQSLLGKTKGITVIVGFVDIKKSAEASSQRGKQRPLFNAAAVISNGRLLGKYYKSELPNYGVFDEKRYFTSGNKSNTFLIKRKKIGVSICEDIWVDKGICDAQSRQGAEILINISCSPFDEYKYKQREDLLKAKAKELKVNVCYVNIVGGQDELVFDGGSLVCNSKGDVIAAGARFEESLITVDISERDAKNLKEKKVSAAARKKKEIETIMPKPLSQTESVYAALLVGTQDYVNKNGFKKVLIGLSGGIDSALVAAIAVDALGKDNVIGVTMPSQYTTKGTWSDAKKLAQNLGIKLLQVPIKDIFSSYNDALNPVFSNSKADVTEENIQARIRGNILMAMSNKFGWLVLTTGNKSEVAVGYCTLYGDMSGGFAVIKDVSKMQVYELARFRNSHGGEIIPKSTIERAPTAELRTNQKDQDSLPPYAKLDKILKEYVEQHKSFKEITQKNDQNLVKKIISLVDQNEYKRRQSPPGIKISTRAFGKDWRLPITNKYKDF